MARKKLLTLTREQELAGHTLELPPGFIAEDVSPRKVESMARGFILGTQAIGRRKEVREHLEDKVVKKIGRKGKYLVDKLFELIDGVYILDKSHGKEIRYYKVPPQLNAIIYALDRVLGKPKQFSEVSEEKKGIILVEHVIKNLAQNPYAKNGAGKNNSRGELGTGIEGGIISRDGGLDTTGLDQRVGEIAVQE